MTTYHVFWAIFVFSLSMCTIHHERPNLWSMIGGCFGAPHLPWSMRIFHSSRSCFRFELYTLKVQELARCVQIGTTTWKLGWSSPLNCDTCAKLVQIILVRTCGDCIFAKNAPNFFNLAHVILVCRGTHLSVWNKEINKTKMLAPEDLNSGPQFYTHVSSH